jgi:hypothetical protein
MDSFARVGRTGAAPLVGAGWPVLSVKLHSLKFQCDIGSIGRKGGEVQDQSAAGISNDRGCDSRRGC